MGGSRCFQQKISKRGKIGPELLLMTNRKLHVRFRLVPKSTTLDDFEQPLSTLFQNTYVYGDHKNMNEDTHTVWDNRKSRLSVFRTRSSAP